MAVISLAAPSLRKKCAAKFDEETSRRNVEHLADGRLPPGGRAVTSWPMGLEFALVHFNR